MIKSLEIQNFQSHKETLLEFEPGVNVIIGPSDSGKTAILRALYWLVWNRPLGDAFRSSWGGDTKVLLETKDGIVKRFKGKEDHYKLFYDPPFDPIEFKAFGTQVPDEVQQFLNLSEINIQGQMDSPFLISNNPGEVSRHFNRIANIDQIDTSLRNVEGWVRSIRSDIQAAENEIDRYKEDLEEFDYLDQMEAEIEVLEQLESRRNNKTKQLSSLSKLISDAQKVSRDIESKSALLPLSKPVNKLLKLHDKLTDEIEKKHELGQLVSKLKSIDKDIEESAELIKDEKEVSSLIALYNKKKDAWEEFKELETLIFDIEECSADITSKKGKLKSLEEKWHENMPEICPLCNNKITATAG